MIDYGNLTLVLNARPFAIDLDPNRTAWVRLRKGGRFWVKFLWMLSVALFLAPFLSFVLTLMEPVAAFWPVGLVLGMLPLLVHLPYLFGSFWAGVGPEGAGIAYRTPVGSFGFFEPLKNFRGIGWTWDSEDRTRYETEKIRHTIELRHRDARRTVPLASYLEPPPNLPNSLFMGGPPDLLENAPVEKAREMAHQLGLPILMEFDGRSLVLGPDEEPPSLRETLTLPRPEAGPPPTGITVESSDTGTVVTVTPTRWLGVIGYLLLLALFSGGEIIRAVILLPLSLPFFAVFLTDGLPRRAFEISATTITYARVGFFTGRIAQWSMPIDRIIGVSLRGPALVFRDKRGNYNWAWPDLGTRQTAWLEAFLIHTLAGAGKESGAARPLTHPSKEI